MGPLLFQQAVLSYVNFISIKDHFGMIGDFFKAGL